MRKPGRSRGASGCARSERPAGRAAQLGRPREPTGQIRNARGPRSRGDDPRGLADESSGHRISRQPRPRRGLGGSDPGSPGQGPSHAGRPPPQRPVYVAQDAGSAPWHTGSGRRRPPAGEPPPVGRRAEREQPGHRGALTPGASLRRQGSPQPGVRVAEPAPGRRTCVDLLRRQPGPPPWADRVGGEAARLSAAGGPLEPVWRLTPHGREAFAHLVRWAPLLLGIVCVACASSAYGFFTGKRWGYRLGIALLLVNLAGDLVNAALGIEPRAVIGVPIVALLLWYLFTGRVKSFFSATARGAV